LKRTVLILGVIFYASFAFCAGIDNLDGYYAALEDARYYVGEGKMDSADIKIREMGDFLKKGKYSEETDEYGNYYYALGVRQINSGMEKEAKEALNKCADIFKKVYGKENEIMFHVYRNIGKECVFAEKFETALEYFEASDAVFEEAALDMDANYGELKYLQAKASLTKNPVDYEKGLEYAKRAFDAYDYCVDYGYEYCKSYEMAGDACMGLQKYEQAYEYYSHAVNAYEEYLGPDDDEFLEILEKLSDAEKLKEGK